MSKRCYTACTVKRKALNNMNTPLMHWNWSASHMVTWFWQRLCHVLRDSGRQVVTMCNSACTFCALCYSYFTATSSATKAKQMQNVKFFNAAAAAQHNAQHYAHSNTFFDMFGPSAITLFSEQREQDGHWMAFVRNTAGVLECVAEFVYDSEQAGGVTRYILRGHGYYNSSNSTLAAHLQRKAALVALHKQQVAALYNN